MIMKNTIYITRQRIESTLISHDYITSAELNHFINSITGSFLKI